MTEPPLRLDVSVACPLDHAFEVWARRINAWWPRDHSATGDPDTTVVLEPRVGGRIYERTPAGQEHDWGQVTGWEPPHRLAYRWHLATDPSSATDVEIRFVPEGSATRVEIQHTGWERLGDNGPTWRARNQMGWTTLLPHYVAAIERGDHG